MPKINGPPFYDIEYAIAHHEAVTARAKAAITLLIDGPTPRDGQLARAVKTLLDDEAARLEAASERLEEAVARHYADPTHREVSEANRQRAKELVELTERYDRHIRYFPKNKGSKKEAEVSTRGTTLAGQVFSNPSADAGNGYIHADHIPTRPRFRRSLRRATGLSPRPSPGASGPVSDTPLGGNPTILQHAHIAPAEISNNNNVQEAKTRTGTQLRPPGSLLATSQLHNCKGLEEWESISPPFSNPHP